MILDSTRPDLLIVVFTRDAALTDMRRELGPSPETITIGRDADNTLVIPEAGVSRHHARLERRHDDWWIVDLGSANGTYVNGERVESALLRRGDLLGIGSTTFKCASTELERGIVETSYDATPIDGLTQAYSRRYLLEQIDQQLEHAGRPGRRLALARLDVERFKAVNDTYGHAVGDQVLQQLVALVRPLVRHDEVLARYAGDELAVLLPNTSLPEATARAEGIRASIEAHRFMIEGRVISLTVALGVAEASQAVHSAHDLVRAADEQLYADQRRRRHPSPSSLDVAMGLCASRGSRTIDVGAGIGEGVLVVADGIGGHCTGWLGARLATRIPVERLSVARSEARFVGAADLVPDDWGWAGSMQSREAGEWIYQECVDELGDLAALPRDLEALLTAIDRVMATVPARARIQGLSTGCIVALVEGTRVHGAHVGVGRALLLRAGADRFEDLVVAHYLHLVLDRMGIDPPPDPSSIPDRIVCNGLGMLESCTIGVDRFDVELGAGDLLLLCSARLDLDDDEVVRLAQRALDERSPLDELARTIERRSAAVFEAPEAHRAKDVSFVIVVAR